MPCIELKPGGATIARLMGLLMLLAAIGLSGTGLGCTAPGPTRSTTPSAAPQPATSQMTTEAIKARVQKEVAMRDALKRELETLDAQITAQSGSSTTSSGSAMTQAKRAQIAALAQRIGELDAQLETEIERYNSLEPSAPMAKP